jgi:hypothetical protein
MGNAIHRSVQSGLDDGDRCFRLEGTTRRGDGTFLTNAQQGGISGSHAKHEHSSNQFVLEACERAGRTTQKPPESICSWSKRSDEHTVQRQDRNLAQHSRASSSTLDAHRKKPTNDTLVECTEGTRLGAGGGPDARPGWHEEETFTQKSNPLRSPASLDHVESFEEESADIRRMVGVEDKHKCGPNCTEEMDICAEDLDRDGRFAHKLAAKSAGEERQSFAALLLREIEASELRTQYHMELSRAPTRPSSRMMIANENIM